MSAEILALSVIILLFSVIVHEVMHGVVALKFGDHTAERAGRLTLNPIPHIDLYGTILIPAMLLILPAILGVRPGFLIGWAKPVPVNPLNFSDIKKGEFLVSIAGVASNFSLAIVSAILFHSFQGNFLLSQALSYGVIINLTLGIFNLLPIPPLDGSKAVMALLPYEAAREFQKLEQFGPFIILGLLYFNVLGVILNIVLSPLLAILGM